MWFGHDWGTMVWFEFVWSKMSTSIAAIYSVQLCRHSCGESIARCASSRKWFSIYCSGKFRSHGLWWFNINGISMWRYAATIFSYNDDLHEIKQYALSILAWRWHFVSMVYSFWFVELSFRFCNVSLSFAQASVCKTICFAVLRNILTP